MSGCNPSIPLEDIVEAIINQYGDTFAATIITKLNLGDYVRSVDGTATSLTLKGGVTLDADVISDLCQYLSACIDGRIDDALGCGGGGSGDTGGITSGTVITRGGNTYISVTNKDGSVVDIDVTDLVGGDSPYIVSGVFVERDGGFWLDFTRNDGTEVNVEMTDAINSIKDSVFNQVMGTGYRIRTIDTDYAVSADDYNGRTIVRADADGDQNIYVDKPPSEDFIGKSIVIRKTNGDAGTFVTLHQYAGVTLQPADATLIRRVGSSVTLVYVGDGVYDVYGELP